MRSEEQGAKDHIEMMGVEGREYAGHCLAAGVPNQWREEIESCRACRQLKVQRSEAALSDLAFGPEEGCENRRVHCTRHAPSAVCFPQALEAGHSYAK